MNAPVPHLDEILELETRHEDLLLRLDELNKEVEKVLKECQAIRVERPGGASGQGGTSEATEGVDFNAARVTFSDPDAPTS
ncbi:MAG TPA: hypothetical protein VMY42_01400 [Thermoguttaceae bacterium]|nr:hypothetical protein [Thermoguttaceae bacterium]